MFYDLNVPWSGADQQLPRTLAFLDELGYNVVALNHTIAGKLPAAVTCAIPEPLPFGGVPARLEVRRRVTLVLTEAYPNARLAELARAYDVLAVRPTDERTLQLACGSLDCDIISLDLTQRLPFFFRFKMLSEAVKSGKRVELCYGAGLLGDSAARRNLISNATQLIRASRGRGLIISSEARAAVACRAPWDAINLAAVWGLGPERGFEAMTKEPRHAVVTAALKRTSYRGVVDVVYGGEKPVAEPPAARARQDGGQPPAGASGQKRKPEDISPSDADTGERPISKREAKRRAKQARAGQAPGGPDADTQKPGAPTTEDTGRRGTRASVGGVTIPVSRA